MSDKWKKRANWFWREWVRPIGFVLIVLCTLRSAVADWNDVPTGSMKPTILEGDRIFVNKLAYDLKVPFTLWRIAEWSEPKRGDIVVLFSPDDGTRLVKRVIGTPGDKIELRNNRLMINGEVVEYGVLDSDYVEQIRVSERPMHKFVAEVLDGEPHAVMLTPSRTSAKLAWAGPLEVPEGKYFLMGDNRDNSRDSRIFGLVDRSSIVGRATAIVLSLDPTCSYAPRWSRFFTGLE